MSTETGTSSKDMTKIDVRVPQALVDALDEKYAERGYASRSEAIRDALRSWVDPPVRLSEEILEDLAVSKEQRERGDTYTTDQVREELGLDSEK